MVAEPIPPNTMPEPIIKGTPTAAPAPVAASAPPTTNAADAPTMLAPTDALRLMDRLGSGFFFVFFPKGVPVHAQRGSSQCGASVYFSSKDLPASSFLNIWLAIKVLINGFQSGIGFDAADAATVMVTLFNFKLSNAFSLFVIFFLFVRECNKKL